MPASIARLKGGGGEIPGADWSKLRVGDIGLFALETASAVLSTSFYGCMRGGGI